LLSVKGWDRVATVKRNVEALLEVLRPEAEAIVDGDFPNSDEVQRERLIELGVKIGLAAVAVADRLWEQDCPMPPVSDEDAALLKRLRADRRMIGKAAAQARFGADSWRELSSLGPVRHRKRGRPSAPLAEAERLLRLACGGDRYGAGAVASRMLRRIYRTVSLKAPTVHRKSFGTKD
jgi:hypothetical protein